MGFPTPQDRGSQASPLNRREKTRHTEKGGLACPGHLCAEGLVLRATAQRFVNLISGSPPPGTVPRVEMSKWKAGGEEPGSHLRTLNRTEDQGRLPQPEGLRLSCSQLPGPKLHTQAPNNDQGPVRVLPSLPKAVMPGKGGQLVPGVMRLTPEGGPGLPAPQPWGQGEVPKSQGSVSASQAAPPGCPHSRAPQPPGAQLAPLPS